LTGAATVLRVIETDGLVAVISVSKAETPFPAPYQALLILRYETDQTIELFPIHRKSSFDYPP
jgi:hypothetical protein